MPRRKTGRRPGRPAILLRRDDQDYWYVYVMLEMALKTPGKVQPFTLAKRALRQRDAMRAKVSQWGVTIPVRVNNLTTHKTLVRKYNEFMSEALQHLADDAEVSGPFYYGDILLEALELIIEFLVWSSLTPDERQIADRFGEIMDKMHFLEWDLNYWDLNWK